MKNTVGIPQHIIEVISERCKAMAADPGDQAKMMNFDNNEDAENWLYMAAIATLTIPVENRGVN